MKKLTIKLDDSIFEETTQLLEKLGKSRSQYINEAIQQYNGIQMRKQLAQQLEFESKLVSEESLKVLAEFESL